MITSRNWFVPFSLAFRNPCAPGSTWHCHAIDTTVQPALVGREVRAHRLVTRLPAKLLRLAVLHGALTGERQGDKTDERGRRHEEQRTASFGNIEVEPGPGRLADRLGSRSPAPQPEADRHEQQPDGKQRRQHDEHDDVAVRIARRAEEVQQDKAGKHTPARDRQHDADSRDRVTYELGYEATHTGAATSDRPCGPRRCSPCTGYTDSPATPSVRGRARGSLRRPACSLPRDTARTTTTRPRRCVRSARTSDRAFPGRGRSSPGAALPAAAAL